jgi:hypothetical protein
MSCRHLIEKDAAAAISVNIRSRTLDMPKVIDEM